MYYIPLVLEVIFCNILSQMHALFHLCCTRNLSLGSHNFPLEFTQPVALKMTENWTLQANSDRPNWKHLLLQCTPMVQRFTCGYEGNVCRLCFTKKHCVCHSPQKRVFCTFSTYRSDQECTEFAFQQIHYLKVWPFVCFTSVLFY